MAEEDQTKSGGGEEEEEKMIELPIGFRFTPTDEELVVHYLLPKLQGRPHPPNPAIIHADVYHCHPDNLIEKFKERGESSWYFLSPRSRKYEKGVRPSRSTGDDRGRWKASTGKSRPKQVDAGGGEVVEFCETGLAYFEGPIDAEEKTKWLMRELTVPEYENKLDDNGNGTSADKNTLDEYVMCRIYVTPRPPKKRRGRNDDEAGTSGACPPQPGAAVEECGQRTAPERKLLERQAGKRPVEEQPHEAAATAPEQARTLAVHLGPVPPTAYGGVAVPFGTAGYYGGTGPAMACYARTPMAPRPPVAHNGHAPVQQPPAAAHNGAHAPTQPAAFSSQIKRKLAAYRSFGPTTMMRPLIDRAGGQAVRPAPSSVVPQPPQNQNQPETEEISAIQLSTYEYHRMQMAMQQRHGNAAHTAQQQWPPVSTQQQQAYVETGVNHLQVAGRVLQSPSYNCYPYENVQQMNQYSWAVTTATDTGGATTPAAGASPESGNEGSGRVNCKNDGEKHSVELAAMNMSPGGSPSIDSNGAITMKMPSLGGSAPADGDGTTTMSPGGSASTNCHGLQQQNWQQQQQQQSYFDTGFNHHHEQNQYSWVGPVPAASDSGTAATVPAAEQEAPGSGGEEYCNNDGDKHFVQLTATNMSPGGGATADNHGSRHDSPH